MKKPKLVAWLLAALLVTNYSVLKAQNFPPSNFAIGMWGGLMHTSTDDSNPYLVYQATKHSGTNYYTSPMGVLKEDGFNVVLTYDPDYWISLNDYKNKIKLVDLYGMKVIDELHGFFKPTDDHTSQPPVGNVFDHTGQNQYNISTSSTNARYNYENLFNQVYSDPAVINTFIGHHLGAENYAFHMQPYLNTYPSTHCDAFYFDVNFPANNAACNSANQYKPVQIPPQKLSDAINYYKWYKYNIATTQPAKAAILNQKIMYGEAVHGGSIPGYDMDNSWWGNTFYNWPGNACHCGSAGCNSPAPCYYNPEDYLNWPNVTSPAQAETFVEASYFSQSFRSWNNVKKNHPDGFYLGKYASLDFARSKGNTNMYAEIGVEQHDDAAPDGCGHNIYEYSFHSNPTKPNANHLWFQAFNSIIHRANGVFFWDVTWTWKINDANDATNKNLWSNAWKWSNRNLDNFNRTKFPKYYQRYISNLAKELKYLKQENLLSDYEESIIYTKTEQADGLCILPASTTYLPANVALADATDFFAINCSTATSLANPDKRGEEYGLRYTLRTNGTDVIMIISNPNPYSVHFVGTGNSLNFANVPNTKVRTATSVDVLFQDNAITNVNDAFYKVEDDTHHARQTVSFNSGTGLYSILKSYNVALTNHTLQLDFCPFDVKIIKFVSPTTNYANGWMRNWTNNGNGNIVDWKIQSTDKYIAIDLDNDNKEELLCIQGQNSLAWCNAYKFNTTTNTWNWFWSNSGAGNIGGWSIRIADKVMVGDFDGDGYRNDLLFVQGDGSFASGTHYNIYAGIYHFNNTTKTFNWVWDNGGNGWLPSNSATGWELRNDDKFTTGNFNSDNFTNEVMCMKGDGTHTWSLYKYQSSFSRLANGTTDLRNAANTVEWTLGSADEFKNGDFDGDGKSNDIMCIERSAGLKAALLKYNVSTNQWVKLWNNLPSGGGIAGWGNPFAATDKLMIGNLDSDTRSELLFIQKDVNGNWSTSEDYNGTTLTWNWSNHNGGCSNPSVCPNIEYIDDWKLNDGGTDADYYLLKATDASKSSLLSIKKYGCNNFLASLYNPNNAGNYRQEKTELFNEETALRIFPNPSAEKINVEFGLLQTAKVIVQIVDLQGKQCYLKDMGDVQEGNHSEEMDISGLKNGVYMFVLSDGTTIRNTKLVIVK